MKIGNFDLARDVLIVAEIGNNHEGDFALAEEMVGLAARSGAHAVKFQTIFADRFISRTREPERYERFKRFAFTESQFTKLAETAKRAGIIFMSSAFDLAGADFLRTICPAIKIASGDNTFFPLLEHVGGFGIPIVLSTGLADARDVSAAVGALERGATGADKQLELALLHCVSAYPTPAASANLAAIGELARRFGRTVGYSDHTLGIEAAVASVALGARLIEKHFTISHTHSAFRDHQLSADPAQMTELVRRVAEMREMLGDGSLAPRAVEAGGALASRRSIAAATDLPAGTVLSSANITWVRPGGGLPPGQEHRVLGRKVKAAVAAGELLELGMLS
jgi:N,N'-diacetyllegionaminate synthase